MRLLPPTVEIDCPRCGLPIYVAIEIGPGMSVETNADGTAEATVQVRPLPQVHHCKRSTHDEREDS